MISGCPTALSPSETALLQRFARTRRVVEAGALLGYSTIQLASVSPRPVVSIDRHEGYRGHTETRYRSNLERAGVRHNVTAIVGDALAVLPTIDADLAFLDLTGQCELTVAAARATRAGLVAIHDYARSGCEGVAEALDVLRWRVLERADTLIILERAA